MIIIYGRSLNREKVSIEIYHRIYYRVSSHSQLANLRSFVEFMKITELLLVAGNRRGGMTGIVPELLPIDSPESLDENLKKHRKKISFSCRFFPKNVDFFLENHDFFSKIIFF